ncbi:penicillin-binding protein 2 [Ginsengibacter hankyongi]|uniref:Penicillin-binding protein 2 n=1 Tax=Ginsengibacter hankyongi TaxID=2607284 RepID=A0A5J5INA9_9BACT|nr:penicillin-binding protein 2 [Ginsengibacter hankyongi]KAA9041813.1 penicillin-binding protein 2 [Ginsengibacter hankyongi]
MSVFNQSRKNIIIAMFLFMALVIILRLLNLQVLNKKYSIMADEQGKFRKVIYPDRGILFDRNGKAILRNTIIYDLMVTPSKLKGMGLDTAALCHILDIDTAEFKKRIINAIIKNRSYRASVFEPLLPPEKIARINESMYKFVPAFYLQERPVRDYPFDAAGNILGYLSEVDSSFIKNHESDGYQVGDYAGRTGLERSYEKVLMGQRGIEFWKRDNKNRLTDRFDKGRYDTAAIPGKNLHLSLDINLQMLGEHLMENKIGAIVALDPKTGGVLAMISSPTYNPGLLAGAERRKHFADLLLDPRLPMINRTVNAYYSPGSTFKTLQALIGLQEGVITTSTRFLCTGAFYGCGKPMGCLDPGNFNLKGAIAVSCNTYFANVMQRVINNPQYGSVDSNLKVWDHYMYSFGLGHKLGIDIPTEKGGLIPTPRTYNRIYGDGHWNFCTFKSVSIGQGEVNVTPLQVANEMAYLANKGWYITPHLVDSIEGGDIYGLLDSFKEKHQPLSIPDTIFNAVHDGMQGVMETGTGSAAKVPGIVVCGKTGTVENYYKGVKQKSHAFFAAFAPRENPRIAIAVICENAGMGANSSAPIASLMIEQYLKDSIPEPDRKAKVEALANLNLMPARIYEAIRIRDSLRKVKNNSYNMEKGYIKSAKDTSEIEDDEDGADSLYKEKKPVEKNNSLTDTLPTKKDNAYFKPQREAILPERKKKSDISQLIK